MYTTFNGREDFATKEEALQSDLRYLFCWTFGAEYPTDEEIENVLGILAARPDLLAYLNAEVAKRQQPK